MQEIDEVVSLIKNGQWHIREDIIKKAKLPKIKAEEILEFLANHKFIDLDCENKKVKVTPALMKFLAEKQTR